MATYYFLGTENTDWDEGGNWYDAPSGGSNNYNPSSSDDVVMLATCDTASSPTVANMTIDGCNFQTTVTVTGICTVQNYGYLGDGGTINGNVECITNGIIGLNNSGAYINGNLTLVNNGSMQSTGSITVTGNLILWSNWTGVSYGSVAGDIILYYGRSGSESSTITGSGSRLYAEYPALYFNNATNDSDWSTSGNWWVDINFTQKALAPPSSSQDAYIRASIYYSGVAECKDLYVDVGAVILDISVNVSGTATFSNGASYGTVSASPAVSLSVFSVNLYDNSALKGNTTVNINGGGDKVYLYDNSYNDGIINCDISVNDTATNNGSVNGNAVFDGGYNTGTITGTANVNYPVNRNTFNTGSIGTISYASYPTFYRYNGSWYEDGAYNTAAAYAPGSLDNVVLREETGYGGETFNNVTIETEFYTGGGELTVNGTITFTSGGIGTGSSPGVVTAASATFNNSTLIRSGSTLNVSGVVDFYDTSTNQGGVYSSNAANFRENSENAGYVDYDVHFYDDSTNSGTVNGNASVYYPHPAPFNSFNGNTGTINGTVTYENYVQRTVYFYSSNSANVYCLSCREWSEITNWWDDSAHTIQSAYVPNSILALDIVFVQSSILTNNNNFDINVHTFTVQNTAEVSLSDITCETLTLEANSILGNVTNQYSVNVFTHDAQLNDSSTVAGGVSLFPNLANTNFQFYDYSSNYGTVNGANEGYVNFFDSSSNHGLVISTNAANNAVGFYNLSSNFGTANANVAVYSPHPAPFDSNNLNTGTVNGEITYFDYTQRTVYFYSPNSANTEWGNVANWWNDSSYTIQSTYVPNSTLALDIVYVHSNIWYNSVANANVYSMTINDAADVSIDVYCDTLTLNNTASFGGNNNQATAFTTNTEFNDDSNNRGIVVSATPVAFRDSSINGPGTVVYDAGFYNTSTQQSNGAVSGNVIVYHPHAVPFNADNGNLGSIGGSLTYSNYSPRTVYFYSANSTAWGNLSNWWSDSSHTTQASYVPFSNISIDTVVIDSSVDSFTLGDYDATVGLLTVNSCDLSIDVTCYFHALFNGSASFGASNSSVILTQLVGSGDASIRFSDLSINYATVLNSYNGVLIHPVVFEDSASQYTTGLIVSDAHIYYPVALPMDGTILGTATYYGSYPKYFNSAGDGDWANTSNWFLDANSTISASTPTETYPGDNVILQTSVSTSSSGTPTAYNLSISTVASNISGVTILVNGLATIENNSFLATGGTISGDALFKTEGYNNDGTVSGTATFDLSSAKIMILNGFDGTYSGNVEFQYGKGVNGSSILGVV